MAKCIACGREFDNNIAKGICPVCGREQVEAKETVGTEEAQFGYQHLQKGTVLNGRYVIQQILGTGGFGITYKALDKTTGVMKAVKEYFQSGVVNRIPGTKEVIIAAPKLKEEFEYGKKRLLNEAQIVARFQSEGIVRVEDFFEENNTSYMVMEYIECQTLTDFMISQHRTLTVEEAITVGVKIADALEEVHRAGVLHRDIAPDNIFVNASWNVKIIDFGAARLSKEDTSEISVKHGFSPPEQYENVDLKNDRQGPWTDIYALGATLYHCLTGMTPPVSNNRKGDADSGKDRLIPPMEVNSAIPEWLNNTILMAMAINAHERFQSAKDFKEALLQKVRVLPIEKVRRRKKIRRTTGIVASLLIVIALVMYGIQEYSYKRSQALLDAADITIWYSLDNDEVISAEKIQKMQEIISLLEESEIFADVDIELVEIPEDEYAERLTEAYQNDNLPNLFEYSKIETDYMSKVKVIKDIASEKKADCFLLNDYSAAFNDGKRIPTGFEVPIIYVNTALVADYDAGMRFSSMEDVLKLGGGNVRYSTLAIDRDLYSDYKAMFSDFAAYESELQITDSIEAFLEGVEAAVYFGSTKDYYRVRNSLPGTFAMSTIESKEVLCHFINEWCIKQSNEAEEEAAQEVLEFLLENNAQDRLYLQTSIPGLPLDNTTLDLYSSVRPAFSDILRSEELSKYKVKD